MTHPRNVRRSPQGIRVWPRIVWNAIRTTPHLTLLASLVGVTAWLAVIFYAAKCAVGTGESLQSDAPAAVWPALLDHANLLVVTGSWLMMPAFVLALIRCRGADLVLTLALASGGLLVWWILQDVAGHVAEADMTGLGQAPSRTAYYFKLVIIGAAILSPPTMAWLYQCGTILDRHVVRSFLTPFALCFFGLMSLFIISDLLDNGKDFIDAHFSGGQMLQFYVVQIPKFLVEIIDISLLLAILYALSRMSRYNEIISMITAGRSVGRILLPLFVAGFFAGLITLACNYQWAPQADRKKDEMLQVADESDPQRQARKMQTGGERVAFMNRTDHRLWYLQQVPIDQGEKNKINQVEIHFWDDHDNLVRSLYAQKAYWRPGPPPTWRFFTVRDFRHGTKWDEMPNSRLDRLEETGWRETPWQLLSESAKIRAEYLSVPELEAYLTTNYDFPEFRLASYRTWWHDRLARPVRCLVVVLFAAPLGIVFSRRGLMGSVAATIILYFAMYFLTSIFTRLGETYKMPGAAAAWSVNLVFAVIGAILLWQRSRNRELQHFFSGLLFWKKT